MYHTAIPPSHFGNGSNSAHPTMFPGPLLPPGSPNHGLQQYNQEKSQLPIINSQQRHGLSMSNQVIPSSNSYQQHPSTYANPYFQHHQVTATVHGTMNINHNNCYSMQPPPPRNLAIAPSANHQARPPDLQFNQGCRQGYTLDETLMDEITTSHLGYLETEDSPHKMEQREKLESKILLILYAIIVIDFYFSTDLINDHLSRTPHAHKFMFHQVLTTLEQSINLQNDFKAHGAAFAFDALAQYAANLISQPWRKDFREIKVGLFY